MGKRLYGYLQLSPPLIDGEAIADINNPHNWINIGLGSLDPNLWGIRGLKGKAEISGRSVMRAVRGRGIFVETHLDLTSIPVLPTYVAGYHEIIYGPKPWESSELHPDTTAILPLPQRVGDLPRIVAFTKYSIESFNTGVNFSYDFWFTRERNARTCSKGDIELMIWLFKDGARPAGIPVGKARIAGSIDDKITELEWDIWIEPEMQSGWTYVAFVLSEPLREASIAIELTSFFQEMARVLEKTYPDVWSVDRILDMYMPSIEVGTEVFHSPKAIHVKWSLTDYYLFIAPSRISPRKALELFIEPEKMFA